MEVAAEFSGEIKNTPLAYETGYCVDLCATIFRQMCVRAFLRTAFGWAVFIGHAAPPESWGVWNRCWVSV